MSAPKVDGRTRGPKRDGRTRGPKRDGRTRGPKRDGRTRGPKRDGRNDGRNRLTAAGREPREKALEAARADFVWGRVESGRVTIAALARKHGVPYGAACDTAARQGWKLEQAAEWGSWYLRTPHHYAPRDPTAAAEVVERARRHVAEWDEFQRVGYRDFWIRRDLRRGTSPETPDVRPDAIVLSLCAPRSEPRDLGTAATVVDLAAYRARRIVAAEVLQP